MGPRAVKINPTVQKRKEGIPMPHGEKDKRPQHLEKHIKKKARSVGKRSVSLRIAVVGGASLELKEMAASHSGGPPSLI